MCANLLDKAGTARHISTRGRFRGRLARESLGQLLPVPKRKATNDEVELTEDDLVLVEDTAPPALARIAAPQPSSLAASSQSHVRAALSRPPRGAARPLGSRRVLDEQVEEDVAGQCLASIAAATSLESSRNLSSSSHIRAALATAPMPLVAPMDSFGSRPHGATRLPSVTAPPFVRPPTYAFSRDRDAHTSRIAPEAPGIRDSSPPAAFIRRSTPALAYPVSSASQLPSAPSSVAVANANASAFGSVAPVSMTSLRPGPQEPTVIIVRERPRSLWILAAAALGAVGAIAVMRFAPATSGVSAAAEPQADVTPTAALPLPPTAVVTPVAASTPLAVAPATVAAASASVGPAVPTSAVMHFAEDQGIAIGRAPSPASPAAPRKPTGAAPGVPVAPTARPAPRVSSMGPALPDGSFGLGRSDTATAAAPSPPSLTSTPPAPEPPRKRVLTPEQQLAEAQLKASMK